MTVTVLGDSIVLFVTWVCLQGPAVSCKDPIYLWPFANSTFAFDVVNGKDGEYHGTSGCPNLETGHPEFDYGSFEFTGPGSYAEVEMEKSSKLPSVTFALFVYPYITNGIILNYEAEKHNPDTVHAMTIELDNGFVQMTVRDDKYTVVSYLKSHHVIALRTWTLIAACKDDRNYYLQVNDTVDTDNKPKTTAKFDTRGEINIPGASGIDQTSYKGRFCCLSVWDDKMLSVSEIKKYCDKNKWHYAPENLNPNCAASVQPAEAKVVHLWPLSLSSNGYNVVSDVQPITPVDFQCLFTRSLTYDATNRPVIYLDGSVISCIQATIPAAIFKNDVAIAIAVRPDHLVEGVIWDIQVPTSGVTGQGTRLTLSLTDGYAEFEIRNATGTCSKVTSSNRIPGNEWSFLCAMLVLTKNTASILANSVFNSTRMKCRSSFASVDTGGNVSLRIGQDHDLKLFNVGFHGGAACLAVVDGVVDAESIQTKVEQDCNIMDKQNRSEGKETCHNKNEVQGRRFRMTASGECPSTESSPLYTYSVVSLLKCSTQCMSLSVCRSFSFKINSPENCKVYDFVTRSGLRAEHDCNYYIVARD